MKIGAAARFGRGRIHFLVHVTTDRPLGQPSIGFSIIASTVVFSNSVFLYHSCNVKPADFPHYLTLDSKARNR